MTNIDIQNDQLADALAAIAGMWAHWAILNPDAAFKVTQGWAPVPRSLRSIGQVWDQLADRAMGF